jgi:tetratricopeptide (TPR) repeat protein/DNA-binding SARP family transcriptional activator
MSVKINVTHSMIDVEGSAAMSDTLSTRQVRLHFLGPVDIRRGDRPLDLGPKRAALLAYLALQGRSRRKTVAQLLWPGSDDPLNNLAVSLAGMKRVLGADALEIDAQFIALKHVQSDVQHWRDGFARRDHSIWNLHRGVLLEGLEVRDWAAGLGEEFEEWLYTRREQIETEWRALASMMAVTHLQATQYEQALPFLNLACGDAGPQEDATRRLMLTLGVLGRSDEAMQAYTILAQLQREELGVEPTARTRAALAAARNGAFESQELLAREWLHLETRTDVELAPLVGRQAELTMLGTLLESSSTDHVPAVVLQGEPGVGKTRLAFALREQWNLNRLGSLVFAGSAVRAALPLQAFDNAIRQLVQQSPAVLERIPTAWRDALARWMPDALSATGQPNSPDLERLGVFEAVRALLDQAQPVLIWLDDLQWADPLTLELVQHLITKPPRAGLVFVGAMRDQHHDGDHVEAFLNFITQAQGRVHQVRPLDRLAITELAISLNQPHIDALEVRAVSGGNPLHVLELLRADPDTQARQMRDLIEARLEVQPEVSRQTLEALGVLGDGSKAGLLQRVSGRSAEETATALEQLSQVGLVQVTDQGVQFEHDLIRQAVLDRTHHARSGILHLRAARAQQQTAAVKALHYWTARSLWEEADEGVALRSFLQAGETHVLRGDVTDGLMWFDRALELTHTTVDRIQVLTNRSRMLERHGQYDEALQDLEAAEALAFETDAVTVASVLNAKSGLLINGHGDVVRGLESAKRTLAVLEGAIGQNTQAERARALTMLGWCCFLNREFSEAEGWYREAIHIQRTLRQDHDLAGSLTELGSIQHFTNLQEAISTLQEAIILAERTSNVSVLGAAHDKLGMAYCLGGKLDEAMLHAQKAIETRSIYGPKYVPGVWFNSLGNVHFARADYQAAREAYQLALKTHDTQINPYFQVTILSNVAEVNLRLGLYGDVENALSQAFKLLAEQPMIALEADMRWFEGELAVLLSQTSKAITCYQQAVALALRAKATERQQTALVRLARMEQRSDHAEQAHELGPTPATRAAQLFVANQFDEARAALAPTADHYELMRLELDIGIILKDVNLQSIARERLAQQFMHK